MSLFRNEIIATPRIQGVVDGTTASQGYVGEAVQSFVAVGSAVALTTATAANVTSISLTPGDWDVDGNVNFTATSATTAAGGVFSSAVSTTSATLSVDGTESNDLPGPLTTTSFKMSVTVPRKRLSLTTTTTVYLVGLASFSAGTVGGYGAISARRVR
jgi:hypothetical protein